MARNTTKTEKGLPNDELRSTPPAPTQHRLPFNGLHDEDFEGILVDLADREPEIVRAELKRTSGVAQYGVDVEGFSSEQKPVLVVSCKRYLHIQPAELTTWSTDFLKHVDGHWKGKGVRRFVLAVTVELNNDKLNEQIAKEQARFEAVGIEYEIWGLKRLTDKVRPIPHAIMMYFHPAWLEKIGVGATLAATTSLPTEVASTANPAAVTAVTQSLGGASDAIRKRLGDSFADRLDDALKLLREGLAAPLRDLVASIKGDRISWDALAVELKATFLRSEGSLFIRDNDISGAKERYSEADSYSLPSDRTSAALLLRLENGAEPALELLTSPVTSSEAAIRAGLLIELGRPEEALAVLEEWPNTSPSDDAIERARLRAIALLWTDRVGALQTVAAIEQTAPRYLAVQWAAAVVRFNFALSPKVEPTLSAFPNPIPTGLVRDSDDARNALDEAERILDRLSRTTDTACPSSDHLAHVRSRISGASASSWV